VSTLLSAVHPAAPYTHTQPSTAPSASTELGVHRVFSLCSRSTFLEGIVDADGGAEGLAKLTGAVLSALVSCAGATT
jgi:hypothetical protein